MNTISYIEFCEGSIDFLSDLVNGLMKYQAERATIRKDVMASMNYENRLKPEFSSIPIKNMVVAYDGEKPIGFAFASVNVINKEDISVKPSWAEDLGGIGFYPKEYKTPTKVGTFKLLYVSDDYRGYNVGWELSRRTMSWLKSQNGVEDLWVFVANGNEVVGSFYEKLGFKFSHKVFNGFITAYTQKMS